jgi:hypothetical protein
MAGPGQPLATADAADALRKQVLTDRFDVVDGPLGWLCRSCDAEVRIPEPDQVELVDVAAVNRLAESAADHGLYCGRCED